VKRLGLPLLLSGIFCAASPTEFLRYVEDAKGSQLQSAVVNYVNESGVSVDLVAAVHVADKSYYEEQNRLFSHYDKLLYEMVGDAQEIKSKSESAVTKMQKMMQRILDLEFQLDHIDYQRSNFVHADLSHREFTRMSQERGENILSLMLAALRHDLLYGNKAKGLSFFDLLRILMSENRSREWKKIIGKQMKDIGDMAAALDKDGSSVILTERNKHAIKVLNRSITKGAKTLGLYYGAAHMPDLEKRLAQMGFKKTKVVWLAAWNMPNLP